MSWVEAGVNEMETEISSQMKFQLIIFNVLCMLAYRRNNHGFCVPFLSLVDINIAPFLSRLANLL